MPTRILGSVLKGLERVYRFRDAQRGAPEEFELSLPIQPVQDLGGIALMGSALGPLGGFWEMAHSHTHTVVGTLASTPIPRQPVNVLHGYPPDPSFDASDLEAWIYNVWMNCNDNDDLAAMMMGFTQGEYAVGPCLTTSDHPTRQLLAYGTAMLGGDMVRLLDPAPRLPQPMLINPGGAALDDALFYCRSVCDNLGTMVAQFHSLLWVGAKGVPPPVG